MASSKKNMTKLVPVKRIGPVWDEMIQMQRIEDDNRKTTDVHLECPDGSVPAHALVLQTFSKFFVEMFMSQGEDYPAIRKVLMPDYEILHVSKAIQIIYSGSVSVENSAEADVIKEILAIWKIDNKGLKFHSISTTEYYEKPIPILYYLFADEEDKEIQEELRTVEIPIELGIETNDTPVLDKNISSSSSIVSHSATVPKPDKMVSTENEIPITSALNRSLRPRESLKKKVELSNDDSDESTSPEDSEAEKDSSTSDSEPELSNPRRSYRNITQSTSPVASGRSTRSSLKSNTVSNVVEIITSDNDEPGYSSGSSSESDGGTKNLRRKGRKKIAVLPTKSTPQPNRASVSPQGTSSNYGHDIRPKLSNSNMDEKSRKSESTSDSDSSEDGEKKSFYKNAETFLEAAKVCGKCKKKYNNPKEASDCITERHKLVRCYFCFDVCDNTEKLFQHYATEHKKAGKENTLLCPFCQQGVPYKSVSTHVISNHLFPPGNKKHTGKVGRRPTQVSLENKPGPKRMKLELAAKQLKKSEDTEKCSESKAEFDSDDSENSDDNLMVNKSNMLIKKRSASGKMKVFLLEKDKH